MRFFFFASIAPLTLSLAGPASASEPPAAPLLNSRQSGQDFWYDFQLANGAIFQLHATQEDERLIYHRQLIRKAGQPEQTSTVGGAVWAQNPFQPLTEPDLNFDGHPDLMLWTATTAGPNMGYSYWLYLPATDTYQPRPDLDDRIGGHSGLTLDQTTKTISTGSRSSCCSWSNVTFGWQGDALKLLKSLSVELDSIQPLRFFDIKEQAEVFYGEQSLYFDAEGALLRQSITLADPADLPKLRALIPASAGHKVTQNGDELNITYQPPRQLP